VIVKNGSPTGYLRVCQWDLEDERPTRALIQRLVRMASEQGAVGVRWSVYGQHHSAMALVRRLRMAGFLCVHRVRTLLINTADSRYLDSQELGLTDAMFCFDH